MNPDAPPPPAVLPPLPVGPAAVPDPGLAVPPVAVVGALVEINIEEWYTTGLEELGLASYELASMLVADTKEVTFAEALGALQAVQAEMVGDGTATRRTNESVLSTHPVYSLTVKDNQVQVVYGAKWCLHVNQANQALVAMIGDRYRVGTGRTLKWPSVVTLPGTVQVQTNHFGGTVRVRAKELNNIITELEAAQDNRITVAALGVGAVQITALHVLPVNPKVALLFLCGKTLLGAAKLVQQILAQTPAEEEAGLTALVDFCRVACTGTDGASLSNGNWTAVNPLANDSLYEWCDGQRRQYFVEHHLPPPPPAIVLRHEDVGLNSGAAEAMLGRAAEAMERMTGTATGGKKGPKWSTSELLRYAQVAGREAYGIPDPSMMTVFYQGLEEEKNKTASARIYVEEHLRAEGGTDLTAVSYESVLVTSVIEAIRLVDAIGGDMSFDWAWRMCGFSLFGFAPTPESFASEATELRVTLLQHEAAQNQKQQDLARAAKATTSGEKWPPNRERALAWIFCLYEYMRLMFGEGWVLHNELRQLLLHMKKEAVWIGLTKRDIASLIWGTHVGIRIALGKTKDKGWLNKVVADMAHGQVPDWKKFRPSVQVELPAMESFGIQGPGGTGSPGESSTGGAAGGDGVGQGKRKFSASTPGGASQGQGNLTGPEYTKTWLEDVNAVHAAYHGSCHGRNFFPSQEKLESLLGREFLAMVPANGRSACGSFFLLGRCRVGCKRSHETTTTPSPQVVAGIRDRMKSHCHAMVQAKNG